LHLKMDKLLAQMAELNATVADLEARIAALEAYGSVTTEKIADGAVTNTKLAPFAIPFAIRYRF